MLQMFSHEAVIRILKWGNNECQQWQRYYIH